MKRDRRTSSWINNHSWSCVLRISSNSSTSAQLMTSAQVVPAGRVVTMSRLGLLAVGASRVRLAITRCTPVGSMKRCNHSMAGSVKE